MSGAPRGGGGKRESGVSPELSRSGEWKRTPSSSTGPRLGWEATVS